MSYPGVLDTHDLMVHDYGPGRRFASAHVEMPAEISPLKSHEVLDSIEHYFCDEEGLPLVLHYDPVVTFDPKDRDLHHWMSEQVKSIDPRLTIHDVRVTQEVAPSTSRSTACGRTGSRSRRRAERRMVPARSCTAATPRPSAT